MRFGVNCGASFPQVIHKGSIMEGEKMNEIKAELMAKCFEAAREILGKDAGLDPRVDNSAVRQVALVLFEDATRPDSCELIEIVEVKDKAPELCEEKIEKDHLGFQLLQGMVHDQRIWLDELRAENAELKLIADIARDVVEEYGSFKGTVSTSTKIVELIWRLRDYGISVAEWYEGGRNTPPYDTVYHKGEEKPRKDRSYPHCDEVDCFDRHGGGLYCRRQDCDTRRIFVDYAGSFREDPKPGEADEEEPEPNSADHRAVICKAHKDGQWVSILYEKGRKSISGSIHDVRTNSVKIGPAHSRVEIHYTDIKEVYAFNPGGNDPPSQDEAPERWKWLRFQDEDWLCVPDRADKVGRKLAVRAAATDEEIKVIEAAPELRDALKMVRDNRAMIRQADDAEWEMIQEALMKAGS